MEKPVVFSESVARTNIQINVTPKKTDKLATQIYAEITKNFQFKPGLIYALTVSEVLHLSGDLRKLGLKVAPYYSGLSPNLKKLNHEKWMNGEYQALICTIAFGAGVDKKDVRFVIHASVPSSMEEYTQQIGRAGCDGKKASVIMFYSEQDIARAIKIVSPSKEPNKFQIE